jgi:uncharacterized protein (TIGR02452 family)
MSTFLPCSKNNSLTQIGSTCKCYYLLLDTSKLESSIVQSILDKFCNPYNDGVLFHKIVYIKNYILACNYEKENSINMITNDDMSIHMVSRGSVCNEITNQNTFCNINEISAILNKLRGNFSFIAINGDSEYMMATDPQGMEKIYTGYKDSTPILFTNYNIGIYFNQIYKFTSIDYIKDGFVRINNKSGLIYQSFMKETKPVMNGGLMGGLELFSPNVSPLDTVFSPLMGNTTIDNQFDYETRKGKYGTSILDRIMCWDDTQKRTSTYPTPCKSINVYEDKSFFSYNISPNYSTTINVIQQDWIDQAIQMKKNGYSPVVLNMTDRFFPACNIHLGIGGQEETIFRRSNYAQTLKVELYPFSVDNRVIYSQDVTFFKSAEKDGWNQLDPVQQISLLACPPIKSPYNLVYDYTKLFEYAQLNSEHSIITKKYLEIVFQAAIRLKHDCLILPAFGCEGHKNPPKHIATIIKELHKTYYGFLKAIFIVMPDIDQQRLGNYAIFKEVIETDPPIVTDTAIIDSELIINQVLNVE